MRKLFAIIAVLTLLLPASTDAAQNVAGPACGGAIAAAPAKTRELFEQARRSVEGEAFYAYLRQHAGAPLSCSGTQNPDGGYAIVYLFPDDSLLNAVTSVDSDTTSRTLLTRGLTDKEALRLLHDMAGASSDIDWNDPVTADVDTEDNHLLLSGWQETDYSADTECRSRSGVVRHRQDVVGLTYRVAC